MEPGSDQTEQTRPPLPRGCREEPVKGFSSLIRGLKNRGFDASSYDRGNMERETQARGILDAVVRASLENRQLFGSEADAELRTGLQQTDPQTGLRMNILLARGLTDIENGSLTVIPSRRLGISPKYMNGRFAMGGGFHFAAEFPRGKTVRSFSGETVGIVLNTDHEMSKLIKDGEDRLISYEIYLEILNAIIMAEQDLIKTDNRFPAGYINSSDLTAGLAWLFSPDQK